MGVRERQERNREAVRRAILDAARELFVSDGYQQVSIRKIAERIEYSPAAIYSYFPSKDDIFLALAEEGFRMLIAERPACAPDIPPLDALRAMFWHYYEFSKRHPEHFALMFVDRSVPRISKDWERFGFVRDMRVRLEQTIADAASAGVFPAVANPHAIFRILVAAVHGVAVMNLSNRLAPGEEADALAKDALEAALAGLRAGSPVTFVPVAACPAEATAAEPHAPEPAASEFDIVRDTPEDVHA